jgi:hypothetical protein
MATASAVAAASTASASPAAAPSLTFRGPSPRPSPLSGSCRCAEECWLPLPTPSDTRTASDAGISARLGGASHASAALPPSRVASARYQLPVARKKGRDGNKGGRKRIFQPKKRALPPPPAHRRSILFPRHSCSAREFTYAVPCSAAMRAVRFLRCVSG